MVVALPPSPDLSQLNNAVIASLRVINKPLAVMLYGAPGSGKGTFGKMLSQATSWPHISTGDLLREHITANTEIGKASVAILEGCFAPDQIANQLVADRIQAEDCQNSFILDGYPRTLPQSTVFLPVLRRLRIEPIVVRLQLDYESTKSRLRNRISCTGCGATFNLVFLPPRQPGQCDACGIPLVTRTDDQIGLIERRIEYYDKLTAPVEHYLMENKFRCWEFDAALAPGQLFSQFASRLVSASLVI